MVSDKVKTESRTGWYDKGSKYRCDTLQGLKGLYGMVSGGSSRGEAVESVNVKPGGEPKGIKTRKVKNGNHQENGREPETDC